MQELSASGFRFCAETAALRSHWGAALKCSTCAALGVELHGALAATFKVAPWYRLAGECHSSLQEQPLLGPLLGRTLPALGCLQELQHTLWTA